MLYTSAGNFGIAGVRSHYGIASQPSARLRPVLPNFSCERSRQATRPFLTSCQLVPPGNRFCLFGDDERFPNTDWPRHAVFCPGREAAFLTECCAACGDTLFSPASSLSSVYREGEKIYPPGKRKQMVSRQSPHIPRTKNIFFPAI